MSYPCPGKGRTGTIGLLLAATLWTPQPLLAACIGNPSTGAVICDTPMPSHREEIPAYAQAKSLAQRLSLAELGSYHKRRGEQKEWSTGGNSNWLRLYHRDARLDWDGDVHSRFDGHLSGFQLGGNIYAAPSCRGSQELGLFAGSSRARGDVNGSNSAGAGRNELRSHYIGGYFTDYGLDQSYLDLVVKVSYLELDSRSGRDLGDKVYGPQLSLSAEKGFTLETGGAVTLEPQLQLLANYTNLGAYRDDISYAVTDKTPELTFRAGLRGYSIESGRHYYLYGNLWHTLAGGDDLRLPGGTRINTERRATWAEIGGGMLLLRHRLGSAHLNLGYQRSVDDLDWQSLTANLGFNWAW